MPSASAQATAATAHGARLPAVYLESLEGRPGVTKRSRRRATVNHVLLVLCPLSRSLETRPRVLGALSRRQWPYFIANFTVLVKIHRALHVKIYVANI